MPPRSSRPRARATAVARPAVFRTGANLVPLNVTVTDRTRQFVKGLTLGDFAVFEDGVAAAGAVLRSVRHPARPDPAHRHQFEHVGQDGRRPRSGVRVPQDHEGERPRRDRRLRRQRRHHPAADRGSARRSSRASGAPARAAPPRCTTRSTSPSSSSGAARSAKGTCGVRRSPCCRTARTPPAW